MGAFGLTSIHFVSPHIFKEYSSFAFSVVLQQPAFIMTKDAGASLEDIVFCSSRWYWKAIFRASLYMDGFIWFNTFLPAIIPSAGILLFADSLCIIMRYDAVTKMYEQLSNRFSHNFTYIPSYNGKTDLALTYIYLWCSSVWHTRWHLLKNK